jgi:hypothetical protein
MGKGNNPEEKLHFFLVDHNAFATDMLHKASISYFHLHFEFQQSYFWADGTS